MLTVTLKRLLILVPTMLGVITLTFFCARLGAPSPARVKFGEHGSAEAIRKWEEKQGFDKPVPIQFVTYIGKLSQGDLGTSLIKNKSVWESIRERFPATIELTFIALIIAIILGVGAGILSSAKPYSWFDYGSMTLALGGVSIPIFWLALICIILFGAHLPYQGRMNDILSLEQGFEASSGFFLFDTLRAGNMVLFWDALKHLILPAVVLSTVPVATIARMTRAAMIESQQQDFIRTAKAKGLHSFVVLFKHSLKNAMPVVSTTIGIEAGYLLSGAILTEHIFSWPGLGSFLVESAINRDFPALQGTVILIALIFVLVNLVVDLSYMFFDPRVRLS